MKKLNLEDIKKMTDLINEFIDRFIDVADPRNYEDNRDMFVEMCITGPVIISANIIDKLQGTFHLDKEEILNKFIAKLKLSLLWVDHKNK